MFDATGRRRVNGYRQRLLGRRSGLGHAPGVSPDTVGLAAKDHTYPLLLNDWRATGSVREMLHVPAYVNCMALRSDDCAAA